MVAVAELLRLVENDTKSSLRSAGRLAEGLMLLQILLHIVQYFVRLSTYPNAFALNKDVKRLLL